jgi:hypothetical protein
MSQNLNTNKFFTVEMDHATEQGLRIMPTTYVEEIHPHKAIEEIQEYIETLETALSLYQRGENNFEENMGRVGALAFELELVRTFLASFKQAYGTMH